MGQPVKTEVSVIRPGLRAVLLILGIATTALLVALWVDQKRLNAPWSTPELAVLRSLWIGTLPAPPLDPTNGVSGDPRAARLGHRLFFDSRLSGNGQVSCATCHQPDRRFTDGLPRSIAVGQSLRNAPSLVGAAYSPWFYWDGRRDSLWAQALSPLEDAKEHAGNRRQYARLIETDPTYRQDYETLFGPLPKVIDQESVDRIFANIGKAIAAYERLLVPAPSRFDRYVDELLNPTADRQAVSLSNQELRGLRLFIGKGNCTQCHNGPLLSNNAFHNTGVLSAPGLVPDRGRRSGVAQVQHDPFNCLGQFSEAKDACAELQYAKNSPELVGAFRTPSLRNLEGTDPYMHAGQQATLREVIAHYDEAEVAMIGHNEAKPLALWPWERQGLERFLESLAAPIDVEAEWLQPPSQRR